MILTRTKILKIAFVLILPVFIAAGCFSLRYDFKGGVSIRPEIKTFSVQYFDNRASLVEPSFSQRFTDALREYIEKNTNLRYVNGLGDVDFSGHISTYQITSQAVVSGESSAMVRFTIGVKFSFMDTKLPEEDFDKTLSAFREFASTQSFSSVEQSLSGEIIDELIEQIYIAAFVNW
ncbi:MAG: LptE family protein [Bacteroidales bacterium]|nr:LptE family protein [Bacteroidales bacterium]